MGFAKLGSWYLPLWVSFATVTLVSRPSLSRTPLAEPGSVHSSAARALVSAARHEAVKARAATESGATPSKP